MTGALVHTVDGLRIWQMTISAPAEILSINATHNMHPQSVAKWRKTWRQTTYDLIRDADLPRHVPRVHFSVGFHFTSYLRRDALNYADTAKPVIDAFGPPFVQKPTKDKPQGSHAPGWTLIDDDDPVHVDGTELFIGQHWGFIAAANPTRDNLLALDSKRGGITIVIRECLPLRATHHHIAKPKPPTIPADVRRAAAALKGILG